MHYSYVGLSVPGVSIWTIGFPFSLNSYENHMIFGTFYALVLVLSYGKFGPFQGEMAQFPHI
jgi:hypothetical protein